MCSVPLTLSRQPYKHASSLAGSSHSLDRSRSHNSSRPAREGDATTNQRDRTPRSRIPLKIPIAPTDLPLSYCLCVWKRGAGVLWSAEGGRRFMRAVWPQRSRSPPPYGPNFARAPRPLVGVSIVVKQSRCSSTQRVARDYDKRLPKQALCHSRE